MFATKFRADRIPEELAATGERHAVSLVSIFEKNDASKRWD